MRRRRPRLGVALLLVASTAAQVGCASTRSALPLPPAASAPVEERQAYRDTYGPLAVVGTDPGPASVGGFPFLLLRNGERVVDSRDLTPLVPPGSPAALAAERGMEGRAGGAVMTTISAGLFALGAATELTGLTLDDDDPTLAPLRFGLMFGGLGVALLGAGGMLLGLDLIEAAEADRLSAFHLYGPALDQRLGLAPTITTSRASSGGSVDAAGAGSAE